MLLLLLCISNMIARAIHRSLLVCPPSLATSTSTSCARPYYDRLLQLSYIKEMRNLLNSPLAHPLSWYVRKHTHHIEYHATTVSISVHRESIVYSNCTCTILLFCCATVVDVICLLCCFCVWCHVDAPCSMLHHMCRYRPGRVLHVHNKMQTNYSFRLEARAGHDFHPEFKPELSPGEMMQLGNNNTQDNRTTTERQQLKTRQHKRDRGDGDGDGDGDGHAEAEADADGHENERRSANATDADAELMYKCIWNHYIMSCI
jgi:hypothetical protein